MSYTDRYARKQSQILYILVNIEILARTCPGKMAGKVTLFLHSSVSEWTLPNYISFFNSRGAYIV